MKTIVFIGSGNLATHLCYALFNAGYQIKQVYSPTFLHAKELADKVNASAVSDMAMVTRQADAYIISVKDDAVHAVAELLDDVSSKSVLIHTAGSVSLSAIQNEVNHAAVLYPMQSFTKGRSVNFNKIPCFIEYSDDVAEECVKELSKSVSNTIVEINSEKRRRLHLAAVFASNMVNHCFRIAERIMEENDLDFSLLYPLMRETTAKAQIMSPHDAQTGPMVRNDVRVMNAQESLLTDNLARRIYEAMAESIYADKIGR